MMQSFLAFRFYGNFQWPPLQQGRGTQGDCDGVVEIHYRRQNKKDRWQGYLRWLPRQKRSVADLKDEPWPSDEPQSVYLPQEELGTLFGNGQQVVTLRLGSDARRKPEPPLRFEGISVLEQWQWDVKQVDPQQPQLRVPLVRSVPAGTPTHFSTLQVGNGTPSDDLRLEAIMPLPFASNAAQDTGAWFAFTALYQSKLKPDASITNGVAMNTLVFGLTGGPNVNVSALPKNPILGTIGWAPKPGTSTRDAGRYALIDGSMSRFWPDSKHVLSHVLPGFGHEPVFKGSPPWGRFTASLSDAQLERFPSLRLDTTPQKGGPPRFRILQRFALVLNDNARVPTKPSSGVRFDKGGIHLRAPGDAGRWLQFGSLIYLEACLSGEVPDDERVWDGDIGATLDLNIGSAQDVTPPKDELPAYLDGAPPDTLTLSDILIRNIAAMRMTLASRRQLNPGQPLSVLPELTLAGKQKVHFGLFARRDLTAAEWRQSSVTAAAPQTYRASLQTADVFASTAPPDLRTLNFIARWPAFNVHAAGGAPNAKIALQASHTADNTNGTQRFFVLRLTDQSGQDAPLLAAANGMLIERRGKLLSKDDSAAPSSLLALGWPVTSAGWTIPANEQASMLPRCGGDFHLRLDMAIDSVTPLADAAGGPGARGRQPVLLLADPTSIPPSASSTEQSGAALTPWRLSVDESLTSDLGRGNDGWRLKLDLHDRSGSANTTGSRSAVLFSQQPFAFVRYHAPPLSERGRDDNAVVASYDSDTDRWTTAPARAFYRYVQQPQSVGESMDKPSRLELHDLTDPNPANEFERPYPDLSEGEGEGVMRRRMVEFRLTPPADLWIRPADVERNQTMPEWALRDIFGGPSQAAAGKTGVGAALAAFRGEFVYGLAVGLWPDAERGPSRSTRVAEIEALTGSILGTGSEGPPGNPTWTEIHDAFQRRPERLELWADDPDATLPFAPARFEHGARFALRTTALHRPAVLPPDAGDFEVPSQRSAVSPRLHAQGLSGGALWPIESSNVLQMVLDQPQADSGHIDGIALGPLGGDADQTVRFCNGRVTIITETRNGHVQRQRVEVVGRIAVWWHRAKHVVIYERTVNPSAQFTPEDGLGTRTRRPVLRKVSEFIELLQPERRYPDTPSASAAFNCFTQGVRFNTTIIPVDSLWGEDVDNRGWKVPLWNRHAARVRPQVYARPDVVFLQASEGAATDAVTPQGCWNPDNLWFFTSTRPEATADTDRWVNEQAIDWINLPPPRSCVASDGSAKRGEPAVPPGFARFTWRLMPAAQRTALNAARGERPVYASLRTITFMRAGRVDAQNDKGPSDKALPVAEPISSPFAPWLGDGPTAGPAQLQEFAAAVANLKLPEKFPTDEEKKQLLTRIATLKTRVAELERGDFATKLQGHIKALNDARSNINTAADKLLGGVEVGTLMGGQGCEAWRRSIEGSVRAKRLAIDQQLQSWETQFLRNVDNWLEVLDAKAFQERLTGEIAKTLKPVLEGSIASIGQVDHGIEVARDALREAQAQAQTWLDHARRELEAIGYSVDHGKPWSARRLDDLKEQIDSVFTRTRQDLRGSIDEACDRLVAELDDVARQVGASAAAVLRSATQVLDGVSAWPPHVNASLTQVYDPLAEALSKSRLGVSNARSKVAGAKNDLEGIQTGLTNELLGLLGKIEIQVNVADKALKTLLPSAERLERRVGSEVADAAAALDAALTAGKAALDAWIKSIRSKVLMPLPDLASALQGAISDAGEAVDDLIKHFLSRAKEEFAWIDDALAWMSAKLQTLVDDVETPIHEATQALDGAAQALSDRLTSLRKALQPDAMTSEIAKGLVSLGEDLITPLGLPFDQNKEDEARARLRNFATRWRERATAALDAPQAFLDGLFKSLGDACEFFDDVAAKLDDTIKRGADQIVKEIKDSEFYQALDSALEDAGKYAKLIEGFGTFERDMRQIGNDLARSGELVTAYADRATRAIADIGSGGLLAAPSNILRAMAALGSAPELPNLECARRQLGYYYGLVDQVVDTTRVEAWFGRLGESLKAWGVSLPFDRIGDRLLPVDLSSFDIGQVFRNCGGLQLQRLFKGCRLPKGAGDAIRLSHDFNRETYRAWVQLDVDAALDERAALVSMGPFCLNALGTRLVGHVRLEASKDSNQVEDEGEATLRTDFEIAITGQVMVTLRDVTVRFAKGAGLNVDFDPKKIELNPNLQFIQNTLGSIVGDELGGLTVVKRDGVPVGLEHLFAMPPLSLMFGTSGVQNIQISNQFQLIAFPDFKLSNRFSLARPELPFIFSIFILGGTGWLTVDVDYRPFGDELMVAVDAAAGGSASLGFAFAGCTGSVAITLAAALTYRKQIGAPGGGLTVSMVLTVYGLVDVLCIASAGLSVVLRLSYADSGTIHARGHFRLKVRISRFFSVSAGGEASYQMAGGQRRSESRMEVSAQPTQEAKALEEQALKKAEGLLKGQGYQA